MVKKRSILQQLSTRTTALTARELTRLLNVSEKTIYEEVQRGTIPHVRIGSRIRFRPERTAEWLQSQDTRQPA
jgi:excisionase family DNA binding protein